MRSGGSASFAQKSKSIFNATGNLTTWSGGRPRPRRNKETKKPTATCANARIAITALGIECRYDQFHDKLLVQGHIIGQHAGEFSDHACLVLRRLIHEAFKLDPGRSHRFDAAVQLCLQHSFDSIVHYLDALQWDGSKTARHLDE